MSKNVILTNIPQAQAAGGLRRAVLAGRAIFVSLTRDDPNRPADMIFVGSRDARPSFIPALFGKPGPRLHVFADQRTLGLPRVRFAPAVDGYLAWGLKNSKASTTVLIGGAEDDAGMTVHVLVFSSGQLLDVSEQILPRKDSGQFVGAVLAMLEELRAKHVGARIVQAGPGESWGTDGVEYVGDAALKGVTFQRIVQRKEGTLNLAAPAAVLCAGLMACAGFVYFNWASYDAAKTRFHSVMSDAVVKESGGVDTTSLERSNARRSYMESPRRQMALVNVAEVVARAVSTVPNARITELTVPAPVPAAGSSQQSVGVSVDPADAQAAAVLDPGRVPDFRAQVSVPKTPGGSGLGQAQGILGKLAGITGMSLRLGQQVREEGDRRTLVIEGFVHSIVKDKGGAK